MSQPKTAIPIQPIDFDIARRVVDDFAVERNVPKQIFPHEAPSGGGEGGSVSVPVPLPAKKAEQRTPVRKFTVVLPDYVVDAILLRAVQAKPKRTAKYVVLQALQAIGIEVREADMVMDGRRSENGS